MNIALKPDQQKWLEDQVASGAYASVQDAIGFAVADLMSTVGDTDLAWAKPIVDEARESIARGEGVSLAFAKAEVEALLRNLGAR